MSEVVRLDKLYAACKKHTSSVNTQRGYYQGWKRYTLLTQIEGKLEWLC